MAEKLNFSLPQKKSRGPIAGGLTGVLLAALVILAVVNLVVAWSARRSGPAGAYGLSDEQVKALASKLAQRNLYEQAAAVWQEYLASPRLAPVERAKAHFQAGVLLERAGRYDRAIGHFYQSEMVAQIKELGPQINEHIKECFESLGGFSALRYELMDRTSLTPSQPAGGRTIAEIGPEKITEAQLDALIEQNIENQLAPMEAFMTLEQLNEQKRRALEQFRKPQAKREFLQAWLAQEILYRQALQEELSDKPHVKRLVRDLTRGALSQQLMNEQLASRIHITEADAKTYYAANKDRYVEPARARIRHIRVSDEERAAALLNGIQQGEDFAELAKASSEDEATKAKGGLIEEDVVWGSYVPGIGDANEINEAIFAAAAGAVLDRPFQTDKGWEVIKVEELHPSRPMTFDEVQQQATMQLLREKRESVQREYIQEMMDKHGVIIHTSSLVPDQKTESKATPTKK